MPQREHTNFGMHCDCCGIGGNVKVVEFICPTSYICPRLVCIYCEHNCMVDEHGRLNHSKASSLCFAKKTWRRALRKLLKTWVFELSIRCPNTFDGSESEVQRYVRDGWNELRNRLTFVPRAISMSPIRSNGRRALWSNQLLAYVCE